MIPLRMRWLKFRRHHLRWLPWCFRRGCWRRRHPSFDVCPGHAVDAVRALRILLSECDDETDESEGGEHG